MAEPSQAGGPGARDHIESPRFTLRTPITLLTVAFYVVGAGFSVFIAVTGAVAVALLTAGIWFVTITAAWVIGCYFYVAARVEVVDRGVRFETRRGIQKELLSSHDRFWLNRAGRLGSSLTYAPVGGPKRSRGIFLTYDQTQYLLRRAPALFSRR